MSIYYTFAVFHIFSDVCFGQSQNSNPVFAQDFIFSCVSVFCFLVPIITITLNGEILRRDKYVYRPSIYFVFWNKFNSYTRKVISYLGFNACWMVKPITFLIAKKPSAINFRIPQVSNFSTSWAGYVSSFCSSFIKTVFRTIQSFPFRNMGFFSKKFFLAEQAFAFYVSTFPVCAIDTIHKFLGANSRAKSFFVLSPRRTTKSYSAVFTSFINHVLTLKGASRYTSQYCCSGNTGVTGCV